MISDIELLKLAIDVVAPAAVRACAYGIEVKIKLPAGTEDLFREVLSETAKKRVTDNLIKIETL
jgi:hypothetical protein